MEYIDLRSDTVTYPTQEMRDCLLTVELGDDVYSDDPTVNLLEKEAAELLGKEAACLVPSGVFGNQCSVLTHTRPGDEIILADECHMIQYENGSLGRISRVMTKTLKTDGGILKAKDVAGAIRTDSKSYFNPCTTLLEVENPTALGRIYPMKDFIEVCETASSQGLKIHLDGARLFNACCELNVEPREICKHVDSVMICLSKGLCAPVGSLVAGSHDFIFRFRKNRKMLGGGLRQAGVIAGPGLIALRKMRHLVSDDNRIAKLIAEQLSKFSWIEVVGKVEISMVFFKLLIKDLDLGKLAEFMKQNRILLSVPKSIDSPLRVIAHHYVREKEVEHIIQKLQEFVHQYL
jgi:threonine aldolase